MANIANADKRITAIVQTLMKTAITTQVIFINCTLVFYQIRIYRIILKSRRNFKYFAMHVLSPSDSILHTSAYFLQSKMMKFMSPKLSPLVMLPILHQQDHQFSSAPPKIT